MKQSSVIVGFGLTWFMLMAHGAPEPAVCKGGMPGMQAHRIEASVFNGRAYVYEAGREHTRSVMLVHGVGDAGACDYRVQIPRLARSYHVIAVDLPGFAQSDKTNAAYSPANYAVFLKQVADRFARRPFTLVGHSMGGVVSLRYAALFPKDLERLVVVDTPGILHRHAYTGQYLAYLGLGFLQTKMASSSAGESFGKAAEPMAREKFVDLAGIILGRVEQKNIDPEMILSIPPLRDRLLQGDPTRIAGLAAAMENMSRDIPAIETETLVIWGKQDTLAPLRTGKLLAHVLPRAQLTVIEGAAHVPMLEAADRFSAVLEAFLEHGLTPPPKGKAEMKKRGAEKCTARSGAVYEGEYDSLTLSGCQGARISNARIRELRLTDSSVVIEDSDIGGGDVGLHASNATVEMTNGRIHGEIAIVAYGSRLDLAGVQVEGRRAAVEAQAPLVSSVVFSISRVRSPYTDAAVHGYYTVANGKPL